MTGDNYQKFAIKYELDINGTLCMYIIRYANFLHFYECEKYEKVYASSKYAKVLNIFFVVRLTIFALFK